MQDDINQEITFRKLSVFMMFMAKGNIARTAEAMKLSSVSVHRALHTLEEGVGCPLFIHKGRNLLPLQAAWTLLEYCQDVISLMNRGLEATRKVAGVGQGRLRIGTLYSLTLETVPRIIMGMKLRRPELELDLTMGSNQMLLDMLEDDALDAILIATNEGEFSNSAFDDNQHAGRWCLRFIRVVRICVQCGVYRFVQNGLSNFLGQPLLLGRTRHNKMLGFKHLKRGGTGLGNGCHHTLQ